MLELKFAAMAFVSLLTVVNPLGTLPIYLALTPSRGDHAKRMAIRASLAALIALTLFAIAGQLIFSFFSISVAGLRLVGGVLFFMVGFDMLRGHTGKEAPEEASDSSVDDNAITPLGIPLIAGPGAISTVMILMSQTESFLDKGVLLLVICTVMTVTFLLLWHARRILSVLGQTGSRLLGRIMGLIVMMVAVEFFFAGLQHFVKKLGLGA